MCYWDTLLVMALKPNKIESCFFDHNLLIQQKKVTTKKTTIIPHDGEFINTSHHQTWVEWVVYFSV